MRKCSLCGKEWGDDVTFCGACGNPTIEVEAVAAPKKQPKKGLLALIAGVAALAVLAGVGAVTNWFGLVSPVHGLVKAFEKTLSADSFTVEYSYQKLDPDYSDWRQDGTIQVALDKDKKKLTFMSESEDGYIQLYDGGDVYYYVEPEDDDDRGYAACYESDGIDKDFFDAYEDIYDGKKVNWSEAVDKADLGDYIKKKEIDEFVRAFYKEYLTDKKWLEENLGYSKKGNTYTLEPDIDELGESIIDIVGDSDAFKRETKRGIKETVDDWMDEASEYGVDVKVTITVKKGYISEIHVVGESEDGYGIELEIKVTNVNKTEIPVSKIKNKVEDLLDEYGCAECGESMGQYEKNDEYLCWDCYYVCEECGGWGSERENGRMLCYDCYYVCEECGEWGYYERDGGVYCWDHREYCDECHTCCDDTTYFNGEYWCDDCYSTCYYCGEYASYSYGGKRVCWTHY